MKKNAVILLIIIVVLIVILICLKDLNYFHKEELSLNQIKEKLVDTQEIYICNYSENITNPCSGKDLIRIENDKEIINEFIDISITLEEFNGSFNKMKDNHTLYFIDNNKKVIAVADFGYNFIIKTFKNEYMLAPSSNEKLRKLLKFDF